MKVLFQIFFSSLFLLFFQKSQAGDENRFFYEAVRAEASGELEKAINLYETISKEVHSANLYGNLGNLYFKTKRYGNAISNYRKALLLDPSNREIKGNLSYALTVANISPNQSSKLTLYLNSDFFGFWIITTTIFFWIGALVLSYFYFVGWEKKKFLVPVIIWISSLAFGSWAILSTLQEQHQLERELIVISPEISDNNLSNEIPLRRFAGKGSSANTFVSPGESLWIHLKDDQTMHEHKTKEGLKWYLVHNESNGKKGWIRSDEVDKLIP